MVEYIENDKIYELIRLGVFFLIIIVIITFVKLRNKHVQKPHNRTSNVVLSISPIIRKTVKDNNPKRLITICEMWFLLKNNMKTLAIAKIKPNNKR